MSRLFCRSHHAYSHTPTNFTRHHVFRIIVLAGLAIAASIAMPVAAQTTAVVTGSAPGQAGVAQSMKVTATITKIDSATRDITLKGPKGNVVTVTAGPDVRNFANLHVGDRVDVQYLEAVTVELKKGGGHTVARTMQQDAQGAKPGETPAGVAGRRVTIVADVVAVDAATQHITLRGPQHTVTLPVNDPEQFKLIAKGDQVEVTYTEALAVAVTPAAKH
jgi:hypothetical protein